MPVLDIDLNKVNADNLRMTNHRIRAVMLYPENRVKRQRFIALRHGEEYAQILWRNPDDAHLQELGWLTQLVHDLRHEKSQDFTKRFEHGLLVGGILATIKQLHDHGYDASLSKARDVFARCREATEIIQHGFVASERTIRTVWQRYKPVAHLWALFYLAKAKALPDWRPIDASPEALLVFLA